jgi:hypothetical protein
VVDRNRHGPDPGLARARLRGAAGAFRRLWRQNIDFRDFAAQGMVLLGHVESAADGIMRFAPDLMDNHAEGDAGYHVFMDSIDTCIWSRSSVSSVNPFFFRPARPR